MQLQTRINIERKIVSRIVKDALAKGYTVSVYDGEEYALKRGTAYKQIMEACFSTDEDTLVFYAKTDEYDFGVDSPLNKLFRIGFVSLVYGNCGYDVISDCTYTPSMEALLSGAEALANKLEETHC